MQAIHKNITTNYIEPALIYSKAITYLVSAEVVKVLAAQKFLEIILNQCVLETVSKKVYDKSYATVIYVPIIEEILFRGVLIRVLKMWQISLDKFFGNILSEDQKKARLAFRVHVSAFIFGAMHAFNDHPNLYRKFWHCSLCYIMGVAYGYVSEKYQTLAISILAHGIHNCLCLAALNNIKYSRSIAYASITNHIICYMFAGFNIPKVVCLKIYHSVSYCVSIPKRSIEWVQGNGTLQQPSA